jgi:Zn-finger nucleic acid-binding protein
MLTEDSKKDDPQYRKSCPVCGEPMVVEQVLRTKVDVCEGHGLWLDEGELESIITRLRKNRALIKDAAAKSARKQGKILGWLFGPLAFLFD